MDMAPVTSSIIHSIGYDRSTETLYIQFLNGSLYEYRHVPVTEHEQLMKANSKGTYFNTHIRDLNRYPFNRIRQPCR
ncbi:KTSC domain-containing protein [Paenibacillus sp.]|uniref:KTSC domain-containing protein n=1 Tax=Paenibacillus sp. TaxID=58172 RepID=UPI0032C22A56